MDAKDKDGTHKDKRRLSQPLIDFWSFAYPDHLHSHTLPVNVPVKKLPLKCCLSWMIFLANERTSATGPSMICHCVCLCWSVSVLMIIATAIAAKISHFFCLNLTLKDVQGYKLLTLTGGRLIEKTTHFLSLFFHSLTATNGVDVFYLCECAFHLPIFDDCWANSDADEQKGLTRPPRLLEH